MGHGHDEIVKPLGHGWSVAWDTNRVDPATRAAMDRVVRQRADELLDAIGSPAGLGGGDSALRRRDSGA